MTAPRVATAIVASAAAVTTALMTAWLPAEGIHRVLLVGLGVVMSTLLSLWVNRADTPPRAMLRSMAAGAAHAFFCGALLAPFLYPLHEARSSASRRDDARSWA